LLEVDSQPYKAEKQKLRSGKPKRLSKLFDFQVY